MTAERRALISRDVLAAIRLGEDSGYDFKAVHPRGNKVFERPDDIADDIAAMANDRGGRLVLGVEDKTRSVLGIALQDLDRVEQAVREIARDLIEPLVQIDTWRIELPDAQSTLQPLLVIDVPRSLFVHRSKKGGYRKRFGASHREMRPDELLRLMQSRSQARAIGFDELPVPQSSPADLDQTLAAQFAAPNASASNSWRKLHLITADDEGSERLSVAAALLCTQNPQRWLPSAYIQCVHYRSNERSDGAGQHDALDAGGPLNQQIDTAHAWLLRQMRTAARKQPWRAELPQFDALAVFEAIVNAVVHRDYSIRGSHIRLHLFADRLELISPGALPNTLTVDALDARQYVRNDLIASLLGRLGIPERDGLGVRRYLERRGDGVPIIYARSAELSGRQPQYELLGEAELKLTIWAAALPDEDDGIEREFKA